MHWYYSFGSTLRVFHEICNFCALHFGSIWASRIPQISSQWEKIICTPSVYLSFPGPAPRCSNDLRKYFTLFSLQNLTGARAVLQYTDLINVITEKQVIHLLISQSMTIFLVGTQPQLPTTAWLQVLITELLIRNHKVNDPPRKVEVRRERVRATEYNWLTSRTQHNLKCTLKK